MQKEESQYLQEKMESQSIAKDQRGLSLIEVVVTLLIASLVAAAACTLISVTTNCYAAANAENVLGRESQIAMNQIESILMKAKEYVYYPEETVDGHTVTKLLVRAREQAADASGEDYYYAFVLLNKTHVLCLASIRVSELNSKASPDNQATVWIDTIAGEQANAIEPSLCANYIESMQVVPAASSESSQTLALLSLTLKFQNKTYTTSSSVTLRNQ